MKYQRINTETLAICTKTSGGYRPSITRDNLDGYGSPEGEQYVPDLPRPTDAPEDGYRWTRATPTLDGYGWEQVEVEPEDPTQAALRSWWADRTEDEQADIYTHAPNAILAWERGEMGVMIKLILANQSPELAELKTQVQAMLA